MERNVILQHFNGELRELDKLSLNNIKNYAEQIGADYKLVDGKPFRKHLTNPCQKVFMLDPVWDSYDNVLMLDIDVFIRKGLLIDIFNVPGNGVHGPTQVRLKQKLIAAGKIKSSDPYWAGSIYKFSRNERQILRSKIPPTDGWMDLYNKPYQFEDEGILAELGSKAKLATSYLDFKWNQCSFLPNPQDAFMIHIRTKITPTGPKREKIENYFDLVEKGIL